ncbi:hypothetical protein [uncultured Salinicola sp.]|uniref:hypothetical protein n=2 Tax=Salinicola TaxID=404432 RepID=UPI002629BE2C|nr:hypothetical protein [uncultured Salinicola sp.]
MATTAPASRLPRRLGAAAAEPRLRRYGAERFEPAWLSLWALGIGRETGEALAWLLAADNLPRAMLMAGALPPHPAESDGALVLEGGGPPTLSQFERWWLWERLARPRRWALRVMPATLRPVEFPLWLGYAPGRSGRHARLIVLSGLSGEALGALKPAVLAGLRDRARVEADSGRPSTPDDDRVPG